MYDLGHGENSWIRAAERLQPVLWNLEGSDRTFVKN